MSENKSIALAFLNECQPESVEAKIAMAQVYATLYLAEQIVVSNVRGD